jgi:hypothetical protein
MVPRTTLVLLLGLGLAGCAGAFAPTPYATAVEAARLDTATLRLVGKGNAMTPDARLHDYVLLKAAEETRAAGFGHFRILEQRDTGTTETTITGGYATTQRHHHHDVTTYVPEDTTTTRLPGLTVVVRMYPGPKPADAGGNVYDAAEVAAFVGPRARGV